MKDQQATAANATQVVDELSLVELSRCCGCSVEWVIDLVDEGVVVPAGRQPIEWRFDEAAIARTHAAWRLTRDLSVNIAGAALALELLDEIRELRRRATPS
ncbi:chaperone modulator CbpM [Aquabacterium humicola]|uniref:chaperone modulator CbpM n=1 Tax=Aquabacterium humicola TaxID=3237377 RepID=UPI0025436073|nr:chaperone modulator CbpM [Rubrivivax pictus]